MNNEEEKKDLKSDLYRKRNEELTKELFKKFKIPIKEKEEQKEENQNKEE